MHLLSRKNRVRILAGAGVLFLAYMCVYAWQVVAIGAAYKAKVMCSGVFISKRSPQDVMRDDFDPIMSKIATEVDYETRSVTTSFPGIPDQRAIFRDRLGCTLLVDASDVGLLNETGETNMHRVSPPLRPEAPAGSGDLVKGLPSEVSLGKLVRAIDGAFWERDPDDPVRRTRAVVVVYDGKIIAERYAPGISEDTALPGWSMAKSVANALVGVLVQQGKVSVNRPVPLAEWSSDGDPRKAITLDHLLRMSSGLESDERAGPFVSDVNKMLLRSRDSAAYAVARPLRHEPGSHWHYSSGTTNIISRIIRDRVGGSVADYHAFPHRELFDKIGMTSAVIEVDAAGTFVASSFMYATARDWARFGLLYLQNGLWEGQRILPEGWVAYTATPSPAAPQGQYGAHFWTNNRSSMAAAQRPFSRLPADMFYASGYEGQNVVVIPSRKLVVVRLGMTKKSTLWNMESFLVEVLAAVSNHENARDK